MRITYFFGACVSVTCVGQIVSLNWSNYTNAQLLATKEKAATTGRKDYVKEIQEELLHRGVVATVTLAQAPTGKEWILQDKNIVLEKKSGGPSIPPPGAGIGQWFFTDPNWLYLEKSSGNILGSSGILMGKIGSIESTKPQVLDIAAQQEAQDSRLVAELKAKIAAIEQERTKGEIELLKKQKEQETQDGKIKLLESKIKELEEEVAFNKELAETPSVVSPEQETLEQKETLTPAASDLPTAPEAPELEGAPEAPDFSGPPEAPGAPDFIGTPESTQTKKEEGKTKKIEFILLRHEYEELIKDPDKQKLSDRLFKSIMKQCRSAFPITTTIGSDEYYKAYITIISKTYDILEKDKTFCKYNELSYDECQKDKKKRKNLELKDGEGCYKRSKFDINACTKRLHDEKENKEESSTRGPHKDKSLQGIDLEVFNEKKQDYFNLWMEHCNACLFNTKPDPEFEDDVRWVIAYVVASGRTDVKNPSILEKSDSDDEIFSLFGQPAQTDNPELTLIKWLAGLRDLLTDQHFFKPQGLMVSYATAADIAANPKTALAAALGTPPVMKLLTEPLDGTSALVQKKLIQSIAFYLTFDEKYALPELVKIMVPTLKNLEIKNPEIVAVETAPKSVADAFSTSFESKSIAEIIGSLEKYQKRTPNADFARAITLLTDTPYKVQQIIDTLTQAGLPQERLKEITTILTIRDARMLAFLQLFHKHLDDYTKRVTIYDSGTQKLKTDINLKIGSKLYNESIQQQVLPDELKSTFLSFDREPNMVYTQVVKFLAPLGNPTAKKVTSEIFNSVIEPYGTLLGVLQDFIQDQNVEKLKTGITALQLGVLKEDQEKYSPTILKKGEVITVQQLYKNRLDSLVNALERGQFVAFNEALTTFVGQAGTVNSTAQYRALISNLKQIELKTLLISMKKRIEELNKGNYATLPGFELTTSEQQRNNKKYLAAVLKKLTPLLELFKDPATFSINNYENAYRELFQSQDFTKNIPKDRLKDFQASLRKLFDEMASDYKTLKEAL